MKIQKYSTWLALPLVALFWVGAANAVSVNPGIAVMRWVLFTKVATSTMITVKSNTYIPLTGLMTNAHELMEM